jgi:adenosylmethionine-8-amino-7-oxononanoate aminotransferase
MPDISHLTDPRVLRHAVLDFRQMSAFVEDPLIFERGEGVHLWDIQGRHYFDGLSGIFVVAVGHGNRRVIEAIKAQLDRLCFAPPLHGANVPLIELSELLATLAPGDLNTVKLLCTGSEATEIAMKASRQYWKQVGKAAKFKVISRYYAYHGSTLGAIAAGGTPKRRAPFEPLPAGFVHVPTVHCYRCPFGRAYPECRAFCAEYLRHVIEMEGPDTVAAVILEPIGNTGGILVPPPEYLPTIREICDAYDVLLIFDEMITGAGRTGNMFAAETFGVTPDMLCLGKGLSSGYAPLSATLWSDRVQDAFWGPEEAGVEFGDGHTYASNPISATAGLACLGEILERDLIGNARAMGARLQMHLQTLADKYGILGEIRGKGLLWGIELVQDTASRERFSVPIGKLIGAEAQRRGLITRHDPDWIALAPPLVVTPEELDAMAHILDESIGVVLDGVA